MNFSMRLWGTQNPYKSICASAQLQPQHFIPMRSLSKCNVIHENELRGVRARKDPAREIVKSFKINVKTIFKIFTKAKTIDESEVFLALSFGKRRQ